MTAKPSSNCKSCSAISAAATALAIWGLHEAVTRYSTWRASSVSGKTLRGQMVTEIGGDEKRKQRPDRKEKEEHEVKGGGRDRPQAIPVCRVNGKEICDVYEDWIEIDGVRHITGYHTENCHTEIDDVDCGSPPPTGGDSGNNPQPEPQPPNPCLDRSQRLYNTARQNCQTTYDLTTFSIIVGEAACALITLFLPVVGAIGCATTALTLEAMASAAYIACNRNAERDLHDRNIDCITQPLG